LWDRIAATPDQVRVPEWHREVLDERLKDDEANRDAGESWDVVRDRLRHKLRKPSPEWRVGGSSDR
jgi:putative addiction module component (TIGR02574 family)